VSVNILACQLIAEIGDVRRFPKKNSLVRFAGLEAPPNQSGTIDLKKVLLT
jgi:transposase